MNICLVNLDLYKHLWIVIVVAVKPWSVYKDGHRFENPISSHITRGIWYQEVDFFLLMEETILKIENPHGSTPDWKPGLLTPHLCSWLLATVPRVYPLRCLDCLHRKRTKHGYSGWHLASVWATLPLPFTQFGLEPKENNVSTRVCGGSLPV